MFDNTSHKLCVGRSLEHKTCFLLHEIFVPLNSKYSTSYHIHRNSDSMARHTCCNATSNYS